MNRSPSFSRYADIALVVVILIVAGVALLSVFDY